MNGLASSVPASSVPAVRVEGVVKRFGATGALDGAGLEVPAGMVFSLLGPNGAGKTTLVRVLASSDRGFPGPISAVRRAGARGDARPQPGRGPAGHTKTAGHPTPHNPCVTGPEVRGC